MSSMRASAIRTTKKNLSFYEEGESTIPDLRLFNGNIAKPDMPYLRDGFSRMKKPVGLRLDPFQTDRQTRLYRRQPFCGWRYRYSTSRNKFAHSSHKQNVFIPYLGVTYDIGDNLTAYASYTTIFRPQVRYLTKDGAALKPQRGKTYETGLKASWFEGRLNASASVFMNKRDHLGVVAGKFANGEEYYRAADNTTTKGVELSVAAA